jgi:hypothetical protein
MPQEEIREGKGQMGPGREALWIAQRIVRPIVPRSRAAHPQTGSAGIVEGVRQYSHPHPCRYRLI